MNDAWVIAMATLAVSLGVRCTGLPAGAGAVLGVLALTLLAGLRVAQARLAAADGT